MTADQGDPCQGCGACCLHVARPPFYWGGLAWERLLRERPELAQEIQRDMAARPLPPGVGGGWPCLWYDSEARRCRHYDYRPEVCRDFEPGGEDCGHVRRRHGLTPITIGGGS